MLELRVGNLEKLSAEEMEDKALTDKYVKELAELKQLLPDIIAKVSPASTSISTGINSHLFHKVSL